MPTIDRKIIDDARRTVCLQHVGKWSRADASHGAAHPAPGTFSRVAHDTAELSCVAKQHGLARATTKHAVVDPTAAARGDGWARRWVGLDANPAPAIELLHHDSVADIDCPFDLRVHWHISIKVSGFLTSYQGLSAVAE